jgi:hydrogenase maturation protease
VSRPDPGPGGAVVADAPRPRVVVAGLGNEYRRDDGAGPRVACAVAARAPGVVDVGPVAEPLDLLGRWDAADLAIVIDAIRSGVLPGTVRVVDLTAVSGGDDSATSTHGIGLRGVLRLAQAVGDAPRQVVVVGIEGDEFGQGTGLSPAVEAAVESAVRTVQDLIREVTSCA